MTIHKSLYPRDDVDRRYVSRKERGRRLAAIEDTIDATMQRLEDYVETYEGGQITCIRNDTGNTMDNRMTTTRKEKLEKIQWVFLTTNKQHLTLENLYLAKKRKL